MYAVIESGGKQYRVELGSEIEVDRLDVEPGQHLDIARVLLVADGDMAAIGQPVVEGALVSANVVRQARGDKVVVFKYKPKARTRVKQGHRAELTVLRIADIAWAGRSAAQEQAITDAARERSATEAQEAAARQAAADTALAEQLAAAKSAAEAAAEASVSSSRRSRAKAAEATATPEATATEAAGEPGTIDEATASAEPETIDEATASAEPEAPTAEPEATTSAEPGDDPGKDA